MKIFLNIFLLFGILTTQAQTKVELTPQGFPSVEINAPNRPLEELIDLSKAWAPFFNKIGHDITEVTTNSMTIEARYENAYHYYNVGVKYNCDIRYSLKVAFIDGKCSLKLTVKEIYGDNQLLKTTVADFFTADGKVKDDFMDAKPSLENTANRILKSFTNFISR